MPGMVIVGAGECGTSAAFALRELGYSGSVTLIGDQPHAPYERPPLSKPCAREAVTIREIAASERFDSERLTLLLDRAVIAIDRAARTVRLAGGEELPYDKLLLATGAAPRRLGLGGPSHVLRTTDDARALFAVARAGARIAIIGAGLIGLELAAAFRNRDAEVTVLEAAPRALSRAVLPDLAERLVARHRAAGVGFRFEARIEAVQPGGVLLADGSSVAADVVVEAVGVTPRTELAAAADLLVENGIVVDSTLATADPDIFAAGDCCAYPAHDGARVRIESWRSAQDQGTHAAGSMLGPAAPYTRVPWFWSDQYELGLQVAGMPKEGSPTVGRQLDPDALVLFQLGYDGGLRSASGLGPGNAVAKDIRLAEMLIERGFRPDPAALADPATNLKKLLRD